MNSAPALDGVRVLDATTGIAGPVAGMLLADFGADVVKAEPPGGDPARDEPGFAVWNRGKRSVVTDPARASELAARADIVLVSDVPGSLLEAEPLAEANPSAVVVRLTPYTNSTPWAGGHESASLLAAATGIAFRQSSYEDRPVDSIYPHVLYAQGVWAATCAVACLLERERSGLGQLVTVAGIHGVLVTSTGTMSIDPRMPTRFRPGGPGGPAPFYRPYLCADGQWLFLAALTANFFMPAFEVIGVMDIFTDERLGGEPARMLDAKNIGWVLERIEGEFAKKPRDEWLALLKEAGVPCGPLLRREDWLDHQQVRAIGMRVETGDPERGHVVMPGVPIVLTDTPGSVRRPAPALGDTTDPGWEPAAPSREAPAVRASNGPLEGLRVLDLGAIIAGPYAGTLLAELGAQVIKVEPPTGDTFRSTGGGFLAYNKGQKSLAVDLRNEAGREAFLKVAATADVVVDNYRPGVLQRLRLTYDDLRTVNPGIVCLSITGFGESGPLAQDAGFDPVLQAMSGMMLAQGGGGDPVFFTMPVNDVATAAMSAFGSCVALLHRARTGRGQRIWTSLAAQSAFMQSGELVRFEDRDPPAAGGRDFAGPHAADRFVETGDGFIRVQAPKGTTLPALSSLSRDDAVAALDRAGIAAVPARRPDELRGVAELRDAELFHEHDIGAELTLLTAGRFAWFSRTPRHGVLEAPPLGSHSREILNQAGVDPSPLIDEGIVVEATPDEPDG